MRKIIFLLLLIFPTILFAQQNEVTWDYPVKPGTKEWNNLKTYKERLDAYNIPVDILKTITTKELVKTCLDYPELRLIFTRNDLQAGYNYIATKFNGFKELESRSDAGKVLLEFYAEYNPEGFDPNFSNLEIGRYIVKFTYIELIMAQNNIWKNLTDNEAKELTFQCINKYNKKKKQQAYYGIIGIKTTALILARTHKERLRAVLQKSDVNNFELFVNNVVVANAQLIDKIVEQSK